MSPADELLLGAIDMHVHSSPDLLPRKIDDLELAALAERAGMRAIVLKSHYTLTADRAQLVQKLHPNIAVFGGLALNYPSCGGFNPLAVQAAIAHGAKVIWMPTLSAVSHLAHHPLPFAAPTGARGLRITDEDDKILPEVIEILDLIAAAGIVLATGHLSAEESLMLVPEARRRKVERIVVTHPEIPFLHIPVGAQRELAAAGAMIERVFVVTTQNPPVPLSTITEGVRAVGYESTVMATDFGQPRNVDPVEGLRTYIAAMLNAGFSESEVRRMVQQNPAALLGL
jgi:Family of unknown function (DUF6282)